MRFFLSLIGFVFLLFTAGLAVLVWKVSRRMKDFRKVMQDNMDDETFRRMADKNYYRKGGGRKASPFDDDYFKGTPKGEKQQPSTRRTTHTASGVTIIDDRSPDQRDKKIFSKDEGEYVDYVEEG